MMKMGGCLFDTNIIWKVMDTAEPGIHSVTVVAKKFPMVFSQSVGALSLNGMDILTARSYRQGENTLASFKIRPLPNMVPEAERLRIAEQNLKDAAAGRMDMNEAFRLKMRDVCRLNSAPFSRATYDVAVNNKESFLYSIIEIKADDFPGLLFIISDAILKSRLIIWSTRIETQAGKVRDRFYVKDSEGRKIDSVHSSMIKSRIQNALLACGRNLAW